MSWTFGTSISAPSETSPGVSFGVAVAVGNDYIAIASRGTSPALNTLHTYHITPGIRTDVSPVITTKTPFTGKPNGSTETFGSAISINGDYVAVGDSQGDGGYGQVSIFNLAQAKQRVEQTLSGSRALGVDNPNGLFGQSVALGESFFVVGAPGLNQVIICDYTGGNIDLDSIQSLTSTPGGSVGANPLGFGYSVSVTDDNDYFMVGDSLGNIYSYKFNTIDNITPVSAITTSLTGDLNIINVSINGEIALVGFPEFNFNTGELQVYSYSQTSETFSPDTADGSTIPLPTGAGPGTSAGFSNSYSEDYMVTGCPGDSNKAGLIQIYTISSTDASEDKSPNPLNITGNPTSAEGDQLGFSVSVDGNYMVAGAPNGGTDGKGYVNFYYLS